ncbi:MAG: hypothetical protein K0U36_02400 [Alphaproteobacteria bacterium]|nr:hypothetical protein [Alphaproteobacteria bacterium]
MTEHTARTQHFLSPSHAQTPPPRGKGEGGTRRKTLLIAAAIATSAIACAGCALAQEFRYPSPTLPNGTKISGFAPAQNFSLLKNYHSFSSTVPTQTVPTLSLGDSSNSVLVDANRVSTSTLADDPTPPTVARAESALQAGATRQSFEQNDPRPIVSFGFNSSALLLVSLPLEVEFHPIPQISASVLLEQSPEVKSSYFPITFERNQIGARVNWYFAGVRKNSKTVWGVAARFDRETFEGSLEQEASTAEIEIFNQLLSQNNITEDVPTTVTYTGKRERDKYALTITRRKTGKLFYNRSDFGLAVKGANTITLVTVLPGDITFSKDFDLLPDILQLPFTATSSFGIAF